MRCRTLYERLHLGEIIRCGQYRAPNIAVTCARHPWFVPAASLHKRNMRLFRAAQLLEILLPAPLVVAHRGAFVCHTCDTSVHTMLMWLLHEERDFVFRSACHFTAGLVGGGTS